MRSGLARALLLLAVLVPSLAQAQDANSADLYGEAMVVKWCRPAYPPELIREKKEGIVVVRLVVDETGSVVRARAIKVKTFDPRANDSAVAAVRQWKFSPALAAGKPVTSCMDVRVLFRLANLKEKRLPLVPPIEESPRECKTEDPEPISNPVPDYPAGLPLPPQGKARVDIDLDATGRPTAIRIQATDQALGQAVAQAARSWTFKPARQGDIHVASTYHGLVDFSDRPIPPLPLLTR